MHFTKLSWNVFFLFENYGEGQSKGLNFILFFLYILLFEEHIAYFMPNYNMLLLDIYFDFTHF